MALKIDIDAVVRERLGRHSRWMPRWLTSSLASLIHQDELNDILAYADGREGADFCASVIDYLDLTYDVKGCLPDPGRRDIIIVSNHPLGALDGITIIDWATKHFGHDVKFLVNDLLMAIEPLRPVFVPINKFGRQGRDAAQALDKILADRDTPLIIFPAGLCSRRLNDGIADLPWKKTFVNRAIENRRDIIPMLFEARNSTFFYNFANFRRRVLPKVNLDMALLPREIFNRRRSHLSMRLGQPIAWQSLRGGREAESQAAEIRSLVYGLAHTTR